MSISQDSINTLKQRIDLRELVGASVELKPAGCRSKGLCPFHEEKSPSFTVEADHYHCYGCGAHGDAISFIEKHMGLDFQEAVELLAKRFNLHLEYSHESGRSKRKPLLDALEKMADIFHFNLLHTDAGHNALRYFYERGVSMADINRFKLGLVPDRADLDKAWNDLGGGISLKDAGIISSFERRLAIPIRDRMGRVLSFSCRTMVCGHLPKYVNGSETSVFKKGDTLFAYDQSRQRIAKEGGAILVEGHFDAIRLISEGLDYSVATMGTAVTLAQIDLLRQAGCRTCWIAFDGDLAGRDGAVKAGLLAAEIGIDAFIVAMPDSSDVDSLVRKSGCEAFIGLLESSSPWLKVALELGLERHGDTPGGKSRATKELVTKINRWEDPIIRSETLKVLAGLVSVDLSSIEGLCEVNANQDTSGVVNATSLELEALALICARPDSFVASKLSPSDFTSPDRSRAFELIRDAAKEEESFCWESLLKQNGLEGLGQILKGTSVVSGQAEVVRSVRRNGLLHRRSNLQKLLKAKLGSGQSAFDEIRDLRLVESEIALFAE